MAKKGNPRVRGEDKLTKEKRACTACGQNFSKDKTQCPSCRHFNVESEYVEGKDGTILLSEAPDVPVERITTGPWDICFGVETDEDGREHVGVPTVSVNLLGGAPGAGKSTLALQLADAIAGATGKEVLYVATEEATAPIRSRAKRLKLKNLHLIRVLPIGVDGDLGAIMENRKPAAYVFDSLSKAFPDPKDAVEFCKRIKGYCIAFNAPAIVIDHVTKEEEFAGLMGLQHEVDSTLLFTVYDDGVRELKTLKSRFGPCAKVLFNMTQRGLQYRSPEEDEDAEDYGEDDEDDD
jgi:DNA repair protein RadA/Sms